MSASRLSEIVFVLLPMVDGKINRAGPMFVYPANRTAGDERSRVYDNQPAVVAQFEEDEIEARFEAEWDGARWELHGRVR